MHSMCMWLLRIMIRIKKLDGDEKSDENEEWKQISEVDRNNVQSLREALIFDEFPVLDNENVVELNIDDVVDNKVPIATPNTSMNNEMFVVKHMESKQDEEDDDDFEQEISEMEIIEQEVQEKANAKVKEKDVLRIPDLDASINGFQSRVYDVYSSFDDSLMTTSVASSSDFSNKSPQRKRCEPIIEWL